MRSLTSSVPIGSLTSTSQRSGSATSSTRPRTTSMRSPSPARPPRGLGAHIRERRARGRGKCVPGRARGAARRVPGLAFFRMAQ